MDQSPFAIKVGFIRRCIQGRSQGVAGGGVATTDLSLATPLKTAVFVPFFSWQEIHLLRRRTGVSLYDHIKRETFQTRTSASPQRQAQVKRASVEQQWTAVWWDAVRLYISKTNFLSCQLSLCSRRTLFNFTRI